MLHLVSVSGGASHQPLEALPKARKSGVTALKTRSEERFAIVCQWEPPSVADRIATQPAPERPGVVARA